VILVRPKCSYLEYFLKRTFLVLSLVLSLALMLGTSVHAKTPKEVLEPYKAYRVALKADNKVLAAEKARENRLAF